MIQQPAIRSTTPAIDIYIKLSAYPILRDEARVRMREELFQRGILDETVFEQEIKDKATDSQRREGVYNPYGEESVETWRKRKSRIRDYLTDVYFGNNLGVLQFERIIADMLAEQPAQTDDIELTFNPEVAPWKMLLRQGRMYESLPAAAKEKVAHHLQEIKVVMIKRIISDQLRFIAVAKNVFTVDDLHRIYQRRIGGGKIGGKAAGMTLAWRILQQKQAIITDDISEHVSMPDSFYLGTEVVYDFRLLNKLEKFMNQKYRPLQEIRNDYPGIVEAHLQGRFPPEIIDQLRSMLKYFGKTPIIVRSSSLLEDSFGFSFAGKYHSYFCPNQGTPKENLRDLLQNIQRVYASTVNPDAILYRRQNDLIDYDERMAILIQGVRGQQNGRYYYPALAGVAFSENSYRWNAKIEREAGFLRLVWGMGTRAVDRIDKDYPRLVALSHPQLRPEVDVKSIRQYAQRYVDAIDLEQNSFGTFPVQDVLDSSYSHLSLIASLDKGSYIQSIRSIGGLKPSDKFILTFDNLLKDQKFIHLMRTALRRLAESYRVHVDVEFTVEIGRDMGKIAYKLHILQCRPLSIREEQAHATLPKNIPADDILFQSSGLMPNGRIENIRYIIFADPEKYRTIPDNAIKSELGREISRLNEKLADESFIMMGPGRWGSSNIELGVSVSYADIYHTKALVEIAIAKDGHMPEMSYGTHFFQDLVESGIYSLPLKVCEDEGSFNWAFFRDSPNVLDRFSDQAAMLGDYLYVIDLDMVGENQRLHIVMDNISDEAIGYLQQLTVNN
jgi:hypothetical protein